MEEDASLGGRDQKAKVPVQDAGRQPPLLLVADLGAELGEFRQVGVGVAQVQP